MASGFAAYLDPKLALSAATALPDLISSILIDYSISKLFPLLLFVVRSGGSRSIGLNFRGISRYFSNFWILL